MSHRALDPRYSLDSCTFQLHSWRPFQLTPRGALDSDPHSAPRKKPCPKTANNSKRPCLADRATSFSLESLDLSKLSLFDDDRPLAAPHPPHKRDQVRWIDRKRRRRGSRSVSGRSSDRSGTARRCCSVGASGAYATCSDFPVAPGGPGTDSSGELFVNGDPTWGAMDVGEGGKGLRRDSAGAGERENSGPGFGSIGNFDALGNESGYGSEPGYRGDVEFGYGDELEEEEEDPRLFFWGERSGDCNMEIVREKTFSEQKTHHRGRRKKHDWKMADPLW